MAHSARLLLLVLLCALVAIVALCLRALAQEAGGDGAATKTTAPNARGGPTGAAAALRRSAASSKAVAERVELARARAIGKSASGGGGGAGGGGGGGGKGGGGRADEQQQQRPPPPQQQQQRQQARSPRSASAAARQQRLRTSGAAGSGSTAADYTYIPVDGRVLLRPRSLAKLRDYTADVYGGINEVVQAQPFFGAASVSGRVGLAARYNLDYSDYLSPRQINARFGPTSHLATQATGRAQGTAGAKAATDSVATRRASYRLDVADGMAFEAGNVGQRLNAASAGVTVERDQANDPFYATVADPGPGLVGRRKRRRG